MSAHNTPTHAYIGVHDGHVTEIVGDHGTCLTAEAVAGIIEAGGWVQRLPIDVAARCMGKTLTTTLNLPADLPACEAAARMVA